MNAFMSKEMQERRDHPEASTGKKSSNDCKKTGQTKMIQGHNCFEYVCKMMSAKAGARYG